MAFLFFEALPSGESHLRLVATMNGKKSPKKQHKQSKANVAQSNMAYN